MVVAIVLAAVVVAAVVVPVMAAAVVVTVVAVPVVVFQDDSDRTDTGRSNGRS